MNGKERIQFVGVTGLPASGKGAFIDLLEEQLDARGIDTRYYSLSDEIRAEVRRRGRPVERPVLREVANELRQEQGSGVLALLVSGKVARELEEDPAGSALVVIIDSIRNPEEVTTLREEVSPFTLVALEAPVDTLIHRIASRNRADEPEAFVKQKEAARQMILGESGKDEPAHGHDITRCVAMADRRIDNSGTMDALAAKTEQFIDDVLLAGAPA